MPLLSEHHSGADHVLSRVASFHSSFSKKPERDVPTAGGTFVTFGSWGVSECGGVVGVLSGESISAERFERKLRGGVPGEVAVL